MHTASKEYVCDILASALPVAPRNGAFQFNSQFRKFQMCHTMNQVLQPVGMRFPNTIVESGWWFGI